MVLVALGSLRGKTIGRLLQELQGIGLVHLLTLSSGHAVLDPLPQLATGHLGGGSILPVFVSLA